MKSIFILSIILIIGKINCGFFDGMNIGLTIPAMQLKVPAPSLPNIKVNAQVKMPPKPQSLKSLLPKFKYNIPTFGDDYYPEYASASNQQSVNILPNQQSVNILPNQKSNYRQNIQLNNQLIDQLNNQMNYQSINQFNKYSNNQANIDLYGQSSNIRYSNYQKQFNYPINKSRRLNDNFNRNLIPNQQRNFINQFNQIRSSIN